MKIILQSKHIFLGSPYVRAKAALALAYPTFQNVLAAQPNFPSRTLIPKVVFVHCMETFFMGLVVGHEAKEV